MPSYSLAQKFIRHAIECLRSQSQKDDAFFLYQKAQVNLEESDALYEFHTTLSKPFDAMTYSCANWLGADEQAEQKDGAYKNALNEYFDLQSWAASVASMIDSFEVTHEKKIKQINLSMKDAIDLFDMSADLLNMRYKVNWHLQELALITLAIVPATIEAADNAKLLLSKLDSILVEPDSAISSHSHCPDNAQIPRADL